MVFASHVIMGMYGFWPPNDERGSWSDSVGSWELLRFGKATTVRLRQSLARRPFDPATRAAALAALKYPPVELTGVQARAIGRGFAEYAAKVGVAILACAILPKHVHLVLARHRLNVEQLVNHLKGAATRQLVQERLHPLATHQGLSAVRQRSSPAANGRYFWIPRPTSSGPSVMWRAIRDGSICRCSGGRLFARILPIRFVPDDHRDANASHAIQRPTAKSPR